MLEQQKAEAQQVLDELFSDHLLPFELTARKLECIGNEEYLVRFYDGRLHSLDLSWLTGQCFKDVFRIGVLERVGRLSGLHRKALGQAWNRTY